MGRLNLEVFKFSMYIMFPIGFMYYFGTNLDNRFSVPDFWPKPEECNRLPSNSEELKIEVQRIQAQQQLKRARLEEAERAKAAAASAVGGKD